jgi:polysaccharide export outer membrane protein
VKVGVSHPMRCTAAFPLRFALFLFAFFGLLSLGSLGTVPCLAQSPSAQPPSSAQTSQSPQAASDQPATQQSFPRTIPAAAETDRTNQRIRELASSQNTRPADIIIGGGDLLHVDVFDVPDLSRDLRVDAQGNISMPLVHEPIQAGGLTILQLQANIAKLLKDQGLVVHPNVSIDIKEQNSQPISVVGAIARPSVYHETRPTTLLELIAQAGGLTNEAGNKIMITRTAPTGDTGPDVIDGKLTIVIGIHDLVESGDPTYNVYVHGGDVVSIPPAGLVYVAGAVTQPGGYVLHSDSDNMTALKAVALARGLTGTAKADQAVILRKDVTGSRQQIDVHLKQIMNRHAEDVRLLSDDILFVPDSAARKALYRIGNAMVSVGTGVTLYRIQ